MYSNTVPSDRSLDDQIRMTRWSMSMICNSVMCWMDGRRGGQTDGQTDRQTDGRMDGQTDGSK
jgi:hypothetical protein